MARRPYQLIFALLIGSVLAVLLLQGFWIHSFYQQKKDSFSKSIYAALEQVSARLHERQSLRVMKDRITVNRRQVSSSGKGSVVATRSYARVLSTSAPSVEVNITRVDTLSNPVQKIRLSDSSLKVMSGGVSIVSKKGAVTVQQDAEADLDKVMDKMLMEIRIMDGDERNADTLKQVIGRVFRNKGFFMPFEFALKKVQDKKEEILAQSPGFNDSTESFVTDLSASNLIPTHRFLLVQFPQLDGYMLSAMKNMLLLSLLFSLLIIGIFYYAMRLILKQKKLSEVKTDFVNNMTHELKTPIATISLAIDSMANPQVRNNEARFNDYTRILKEENKKLNDHVERVLQMALLDKGELRLHKTETDLVPLLRAVIDTYRLQIAEQGADVNFTPVAEAVLFKADAFHLRNVFSNLLDNALKYTRGQCRVRITIEESSSQVLVTFKDNGIGIDAQQAEKIFGRFYRVQGGNLHDVKGFGLGLSYARSIVEAHGGSIGLQSRKGEGSAFIIQLNRHD